METVCNRIFGENSAIEVDIVDEEDHNHHHHHFHRNPVRPDDCKGSVTSSDRVISPVADSSRVTATRRFDKVLQVPISSSILNPNASEFIPRQNNQDARTMFLTFSKGYPLSREEIINFFTS